MATRSTLTVQDQQACFHVYRHFDGYPDSSLGVIHAVRAAMKRAWPLPGFEAGDYTAALIAQMKKNAGNIYLIADPNRHSDRDYHYEIDFKNEELSVKVFRYRQSIARLIFDGSIDRAATRFKADYLPDGTLADDACGDSCDPINDAMPALIIPAQGRPVLEVALTSAQRILHQLDPKAHQQAINQLKMARALLGSMQSSKLSCSSFTAPPNQCIIVPLLDFEVIKPQLGGMLFPSIRLKRALPLGSALYARYFSPRTAA